MIVANVFDEFVQYLDRTKPVYYTLGIKEGEFIRAVYIELHGTSLGQSEMVFRAVKLQLYDENPEDAMNHLVQKFAAPLGARQAEFEAKLA